MSTLHINEDLSHCISQIPDHQNPTRISAFAHQICVVTNWTLKYVFSTLGFENVIKKSF